jgi:hypothetical protein
MSRRTSVMFLTHVCDFVTLEPDFPKCFGLQDEPSNKCHVPQIETATCV